MPNAENFSADLSADDDRWMQRALELAREGVGLASPNPTVGCVIVKDSVCVGEGFHRYEFRDHAEVVALREAGENARGATAYVTLEPCSHTGRTPPCANALIAAGVARVVAATLDPNPAVSGTGMQRLKSAGIMAENGLLQQEARALNNAFAKFILHGIPFVTLKAALSKDGYLAPAAGHRVAKQSYRLTGDAADAETQRMRHAVDAIVTGIGTVLADDPQLTDRSGLPRRRPLLRVVMDTALQMPLDSRLVTTAQSDVLIFCGVAADAKRRRKLEDAGVIVFMSRNAQPQPLEVLEELARRGMTHVLLEAGAKINGAFLDAHAVDELLLFYTPHILGAGSVPFTNNQAPMDLLEGYMKKLVRVVHGKLQEDITLRGLLVDPWAGL